MYLPGLLEPVSGRRGACHDAVLLQSLKPTPFRMPQDSHYRTATIESGGWRVWREDGEDESATILHVVESCELPSSSAGYGVTLQEAVIQSLGGMEWVRSVEEEGTIRVPVSFRKIEKIVIDWLAGPIVVGQNPWERVRHTHVAILPDGIILPIREVKSA